MASIPDIDLPPSFPSAHSAQRASSGTGPRPTTTASANKAAPSFSVSGPDHNATASSSSSSSSSKVQALRDVLATGNDDAEGSSSSIKASSLGAPSKNSSATLTAPAASSSSSLMPPPSTSRLTAPPGVGGAPTSSAPASSLAPSSSAGSSSSSTTSKRKKVILTPGHSPLDWARLKSTLSPPFPFRKIPLSEVKQHKQHPRDGPAGAWTVLNGKVYDMTPYLKFHPGGEEELMRVAGRDGTRLFMLTHSWVNVDSVVDGCCIGIAVKDD